MIRKFLTLAVAACFALAACAPAKEAEQGPIVLAASSMQEALDAAAADWAEQGHPRPVLSFAATSALARQVESGAAGDLFISADTKWMAELDQAGHLAPGSERVLAGNSLVLVGPKGSAAVQTIDAGFPLAASLGQGRLAMADPEAVPAGRYGKDALENLGLWDQVSDKLAIGENVRVALALVSRGEAPLGIVYATDAKAEPEVVVVGRFPSNSHAPIAYPIARLSNSGHAEASAFEDFLLSERGQAIFQRFGFESVSAGD